MCPPHTLSRPRRGLLACRPGLQEGFPSPSPQKAWGWAHARGSLLPRVPPEPRAPLCLRKTLLGGPAPCPGRWLPTQASWKEARGCPHAAGPLAPTPLCICLLSLAAAPPALDSQILSSRARPLLPSSAQQRGALSPSSGQAGPTRFPVPRAWFRVSSPLDLPHL